MVTRGTTTTPHRNFRRERVCVCCTREVAGDRTLGYDGAWLCLGCLADLGAALRRRQPSGHISAETFAIAVAERFRELHSESFTPLPPTPSPDSGSSIPLRLV
jgi:hypothetical protein